MASEETPEMEKILSLKELGDIGAEGALGADALQITAEGRLARKKLTETMRFGFTFRHHPFAVMVHQGVNGGLLSLCGEIGYLPFSAQSAFARSSIRQLIDRANDLRHGRFVLQKDHKILLHSEIAIRGSFNRPEILAAACRGIFDALPYLELINECLAYAVIPERAPPPPDGEEPHNSTVAPPDSGES